MDESNSRPEMKTLWILLKTMHEDLVSGNCCLRPIASADLVEVVKNTLTSEDGPCSDIPESCSHCHKLLLLTNMKLLFEIDVIRMDTQSSLQKDLTDSSATERDRSTRGQGQGRDGSVGAQERTMNVDGDHLSWKKCFIASVGIENLITWLLGLLKSSQFVRYAAAKTIVSGFKGHTFQGHEKSVIESILRDLTSDRSLHPTACLGVLKGLMSRKAGHHLNQVTSECLKSYFNSLCVVCWEQGSDCETSEVKLKPREVSSEVRLKSDSEVRLKSDSEVRLKSNSEVRLKSDSEVRLKSDSEVRLKVGAEAGLDTEFEVRTDIEVRLKIDSAVGLKIDSEVELKIDSEVGLKTDSEVGLKTDLELGLKTNSEVGLKTDSEVRLKTDLEVGLKTDSEVGLKNYSQVGLKTDLELGLKTNSEVGLKTNSEVRLETDSELKLKTDSKIGLKTDSEVGLKVIMFSSEVRLAFLCLLQKVIKYFNTLDESVKQAELQAILPFVSNNLVNFLFNQTHFHKESSGTIPHYLPLLETFAPELYLNCNDTFSITHENFCKLKTHTEVTAYSRLLYKKVVDIFNTILCYGHELAQKRLLGDDHHIYLSLSVAVLSQVSQRGLNSIPYTPEFVGFGGTELEAGKSSGECPQLGDAGLLRKLFLLLFKMCAISVKSSEKDKPDLCIQMVTGILLEINRYVTDHLTLTYGDPNDLSWLPTVFRDQDDAWIETLLCLVDIYLALSRNTADVSLVTALNPHKLFLQFLDSTTNDHSVLVDLLTSPETCFLLYLVRYLKCVLTEWDTFVAVCHSKYCSQDHQNEQYPERLKRKTRTAKHQSQKHPQSVMRDTFELPTRLAQGNQNENILLSHDEQITLRYDGPGCHDESLTINIPQKCLMQKPLKRKANGTSSLTRSDDESLKNCFSDGQSVICKDVDKVLDSIIQTTDGKRRCIESSITRVETKYEMNSLPEVCLQGMPPDGLSSLALSYGDDEDDETDDEKTGKKSRTSSPKQMDISNKSVHEPNDVNDDDDDDKQNICDGDDDEGDGEQPSTEGPSKQNFCTKIKHNIRRKCFIHEAFDDNDDEELMQIRECSGVDDKNQSFSSDSEVEWEGVEQSNKPDSMTEQKGEDQSNRPSYKTEHASIDQSNRPDSKTEHASLGQINRPDSKTEHTSIAQSNRPSCKTQHASIAQSNSPDSKTDQNACNWSCVDQVLAMFIRVRLKITKLHDHDLFPYNPRPLLAVLQQCEDRYELITHDTR